MIERPFWTKRIESAWSEAPIVWLAGVRRSGKTTLARSLGEERVRYVDCDLPAVADLVADPQLFFSHVGKPVVVFDEIHQLRDPATVLKIGADLFPKIKILATGSSTLAASRKFKDTLTGRKRLVRLTPVLWDECSSFGNATLAKRLYHGGLPDALLAGSKLPGFFREWLDSFFARDIQRLFAFRDPDKFHALLEHVMRQSGGLFDASRVAATLGIGRPTVENHLRALEATHAATLVRPFFGGGPRELVKMPKAYGFDTGFVSFCRGWDPLRPDDHGPLWEHVVLEYLQAHLHEREVRFWRDKAGHEIDFVVARRRDEVDAIECKWDPKQFDPTALTVFRSFYTKGTNYLVCPLTIPAYVKKAAGLEIRVCAPDGLLS